MSKIIKVGGVKNLPLRKDYSLPRERPSKNGSPSTLTGSGAGTVDTITVLKMFSEIFWNGDACYWRGQVPYWR